MSRTSPIVLVAMALLAAAVPFVPAAPAAHGTASITITSPADGVVIDSGTVVASVNVQNFKLVNYETAGANAIGTGHIHWFIDGALAGGAYPGNYATTATTFVFSGLAPGKHTIKAELVGNDHTSYANGGVLDEVTFTVAEGASAVKFTSPAGKTLAQNGQITVNVDVKNLQFAGVKLQNIDANKARTGHLHYLITDDSGKFVTATAANSSKLYATTDTTFTYANVGPGARTLRVELVNNDHTSFTPPVYSDLVVNVPTLSFTGAPAEGSTITGTSTAVTVAATGFSLVGFPKAAAPGEGHIHYFVDGKPAPGDYATPGTSFTFTGLTTGRHTITAELVDSEHASLNPPVVASRTFTVGGPAVDFVGLLNGATVGVDAPVKVDVTGFSFGNVKLSNVDANQANAGHIHYLVQNRQTKAFEPAATNAADELYATTDKEFVFKLAEGEQTIAVELVNNDHTSLNPRAIATRTVNVVKPSLSFATGPAEGAATGLAVPVTVRVAGFTYDSVNLQNPANVPGKGHIHYFVDGKPAESAVDGQLYANTDGAFTYRLTPGTHVLRAELVNNDHTPLVPPVFVERTVRAEAMSISFVGLENGARIGTALPVTVDVKGFTFNGVKLENIDANKANTGHIHYFVDGKPAESAVEGDLYASSGKSFVYKLTPGRHTITAELVNNDHTSFTPKVIATREVTAVNPKVEIVGLDNNPVVGTVLPITVNVEGITFGGIDLVSPKNVPGQGHLHFLVDGKPAESAIDGKVYATSEKTFVAKLTPGEHVIRVELVNNDHTPVTPAAVATRTVKVVAPAIDFTSVKDGDQVGETFVATVKVQGFTFNGVKLENIDVNAANTGHIHYTVDGKTATSAVKDKLYATTDQEFAFALTPGTHKIAAELVNNDHTPLSPRVFVERTVTVAGAAPASAPTVDFVGLVNGFEVKGNTLAVTVKTTGFSTAPVKLENIAPNVPATGHLHFLVDGKPAETVKGALYATEASAFTFANLTAGEHKVRVELVNNDHTSLSPPVFAERTIKVSSVPGVAAENKAKNTPGPDALLLLAGVVLAVALVARGRRNS